MNTGVKKEVDTQGIALPWFDLLGSCVELYQQQKKKQKYTSGNDTPVVISATILSIQTGCHLLPCH